MRRLPRLTKKRVISAIAVIIISIIGQFLLPSSKLPNPSPPVAPPSTSPTYAKVIRVIDGDTIEIAGGQRVRYIGINTSELATAKKPDECFARAASDKNKELVEGKTIRLEKDISNTDKYGRLLRYIYLNDLMVNDYLVKEGYAKATPIRPDIKYAKIFAASQIEAKKAAKGLWQQCQQL